MTYEEFEISFIHFYNVIKGWNTPANNSRL